jgi:hypothetical protein
LHLLRNRLGTGAERSERCKNPFLLDRSIDVKDKSLYMTTVTANNVLEGSLVTGW